MTRPFFAKLTESSHGRCYGCSEIIELRRKRKSGMSLAEITLAHCEDGWRAAHGFGFTGGDCWGSWSPIFASSPTYPTRQDAIAAEADRLRERIKDREGPEANAIRTWLNSLKPSLFDLMENAA